MLDIKFIRENKKEVEKNCKNRLVDCDIDKLLELDEKVRGVKSEIDDLRAKRNIKSKTKPSAAEIGAMKKVGEEEEKLETELKP